MKNRHRFAVSGLLAIAGFVGCSDKTAETPRSPDASVDAGRDVLTDAGASDAPANAGACRSRSECGADYCCAEESADTPRRATTSCRSSCITGVARVEVCATDQDCAASGHSPAKCQEYTCGGFDMQGLRTCAPLAPCE